MLPRSRRLINTLMSPVSPVTRERLKQLWQQVPDKYRSSRQMYGRTFQGCGATIGAMPRCDFACKGCYLSEGANSIPAHSIDELKAQMRSARDGLGQWGNLQLTDGEITLRTEDELIELLHYAKEIELLPMIMSHGDTFRRRPGLLERLMVDGGLRELSIHIDTTQRGRVGKRYKHAALESELMPLRDEFAAMIREARKKTGLPLRVSTTMTVSRDNLSGVADVMKWLSHNSDAFSLISFQPVAPVGRTEDVLERVTPDELWREIAQGLYGVESAVDTLDSGNLWHGHPACNRYVNGIFVDDLRGCPTFLPLIQIDNAPSEAILNDFIARFGGLCVRADEGFGLWLRVFALVIHAPWLMTTRATRYAYQMAKRIDSESPLRAAWKIVTGRLRLRQLLIISHHFMSPAELETSEGQERLDLCVFRVPIDGRMVPMCEVNATPIREKYYQALTAQKPEELVAHRLAG